MMQAIYSVHDTILAAAEALLRSLLFDGDETTERTLDVYGEVVDSKICVRNHAEHGNGCQADFGLFGGQFALAFDE